MLIEDYFEGRKGKNKEKETSSHPPLNFKGLGLAPRRKELFSGCRGFTGPVPPPLSIRVFDY
jgi:hypothetical protein